MARTGRVDHLDGIRAVAIGGVLALHWVSWYVPLFHGGSVGVDMFFVLSGFIITTVLWRSELTDGWWPGCRTFLVRRAVRLYPALIGLVLGCVVLYSVVPWARIGPLTVAGRGLVVLVQGSAIWATGQHGSLWVPRLHPFGQTWSLAVEWYFYLLWPFLLLGARVRGWTARRVGVVTLVLALLLYAASLPLGTFAFYFGPTARAAELLVGAALALLVQAQGPPEPAWRHARLAGLAGWVGLAGVAAYVLVGKDGHSPLYRFVGLPWAVAATVVLIVLGRHDPGSAVIRLLGHRWLATVGRHSYSLYLWHIVPFLLLANAPGGMPKPVLGVLTLVFAALMTVLSYRFLERPFLRPRSDVLRVAPAQPPATVT